MTVVFFIFLIAAVLALCGVRIAAVVIALINLVLCLWILWYHATDALEVLL